MAGTPVSWFGSPAEGPASGQKSAGDTREEKAAAGGSATPGQKPAKAPDDAPRDKDTPGDVPAPTVGGEPRVFADDATRVVVTVDEENSDPGHRPSPTARSVKVVSGTGRFHTTNCPLVRAAAADSVETMPRAKAEAAGLTHCLVCITSD
ncbi:hypothetical protein DP939_11205 [Spongiactinospora rosea]|uniref:Uncharacterized protein n=1 Tax=Spongiactinospora rosea TaxID=2248750 RepID=A0A366M434_9ACTN|nr:hypothetical protein [Spongiactinospora rosea]RBQ20354.1 hypothetical protein DP939_11205 [Spongiactinospora rosea]